MKNSPAPCALCPIVGKIAYWGPRPVRLWKRLALFFCSLAILGLAFMLIGVVGTEFFSHPGYSILTAFLLGISIGGFIVAFKACDSCVARFFGDPF